MASCFHNIPMSNFNSLCFYMLGITQVFKRSKLYRKKRLQSSQYKIIGENTKYRTDPMMLV